jgi:AraC family transcriptional regulator
MEPTMVEKGQMILLGFSFFGDPFEVSGDWTEENEIGRLWNRLMTYLASHRHRIKHVKSDAVFYEVHVEHEETMLTGEFEVFVGLEVEKLEDVPVEMSVKLFPATTYAVFTLQGAQITSDWSRMIGAEWMPRSGYQRAHAFGFQRYDERFKGLERIDESILDVYVPVERSNSVPG